MWWNARYWMWSPATSAIRPAHPLSPQAISRIFGSAAASPWQTRRSCARRFRGRIRSSRTRSRCRSANTGRRAGRRSREPAGRHCQDRCSRRPRRRLPGVGRANALRCLHVLPAAVRLEVDAHERLGADGPAEADELTGPHLVRFDPTPEQVEHRWTRVARPDAFPPAVEVRKDPPHRIIVGQVRA